MTIKGLAGDELLSLGQFGSLQKMQLDSQFSTPPGTARQLQLLGFLGIGSMLSGETE